ncbi:MAG: hypothetical protein ABI684_07340 [Nitrospirota bacterium]
MGTLLFLLWFGYVLGGVFTPVLIGLGLTYVFNPVITASQMRWRASRIVSTSVLVNAIFIVVAGFIAWFGPLIGWPLAVLLKYLDVITGDTARLNGCRSSCGRAWSI